MPTQLDVERWSIWEEFESERPKQRLIMGVQVLELGSSSTDSLQLESRMNNDYEDDDSVGKLVDFFAVVVVSSL